MLDRSGEITAPCPVPLSLTVTIPSSRTPALSHFRIRRMMRGSPIRCSTKTDQPIMAHRIEERPNIGVQYEVHFSAGDPNTERVKRIMRAASRSESVREPEEVFLVDRVQHRNHRSLNDLVFESGDRERALSAIRLRYVHTRRLGSARYAPR